MLERLFCKAGETIVLQKNIINLCCEETERVRSQVRIGPQLETVICLVFPFLLEFELGANTL